MTEKIIIAGAGGQGIMLLGKVLTLAAMKEGKFVTWLPAYGAEVRGGAAHCMSIISDSEISSPYIEKSDSAIIMNKPSLEKFRGRIINGGLLVLNSSLADADSGKKLRVVKFPFTEIAQELGNVKTANMIALGCFLGIKKIVDIKSVIDTIEEIAPSDKKGLIEINKQALFKGVDLKND